MIDDGEATIHDAAGIIEADGRQSPHAMETCSDEASGSGLGDDPGPLADPVGCTTTRIDAFPSPAPVPFLKIMWICHRFAAREAVDAVRWLAALPRFP